MSHHFSDGHKQAQEIANLLKHHRAKKWGGSDSVSTKSGSKACVLFVLFCFTCVSLILLFFYWITVDVQYYISYKCIIQQCTVFKVYISFVVINIIIQGICYIPCVVQHILVAYLCIIAFTFWRRKWQPTPVFLSGEFHGQRNLAGCSSWDHKSRTRLSAIFLSFLACAF